MKAILLFLFVSMLFTANSNGQNTDVPIVPAPQIVHKQAGSFNISAKTKIIISGLTPEKCRFSAELLKQTLKTLNNLDLKISEGNPEKGSIVLLKYAPAANQSFISPAESNEEGYTLNVTKDGISIKSTSEKGILYGVMSLNQLLEKAGKNPLNSLEIIDWPDMKMRGISDDISRGQVSTLDNFKKIIRFMARYKMNTYMPYLEDMLRFDSYPSIGVNRGALTKDEVKELVAYAKNYFIDVIPAFQTLGHYENILSQEEFLKYAEFPGAASLNVSNDSTYMFLDNLLKEACSLFPSEYFNMGADESYDVGLGKSKHLVDQSSIAQVHLNHYVKVYNILKKYGKKVMMYGDIILSHPEILEGLPKDITVVDWHYRPENDYPSTRVFAKAGHPYVVSPSVWNYTSAFPVNVNAIPNIRYITASGLQDGSMGMINSNWGDFGAETFKELNYFGYAWSAQCAWNYKGSNEDKFARDFLGDFFGLSDQRLVNIYASMNTILNQVLWNEVWRHPLLPLRDPAWWEPKVSPVVKISWMESTLPSTLQDIKETQILARKNKDHFDLLRFIIKLDEWYKTKLNTQFLLQDKLAGREVDAKSLNSLIDENLSAIKDLKAEFKNLWLRYYKKDNLWMIEDKFDRLSSYFAETKNQLKNGTLHPAQLASDWIYCKTNDSTFAKSARFRKTFTLAEKPASAMLQLLGDTYAKLYINGQYVEQVFEKRSLSLYTEYKRIKMLDIAKYLKEGENSITVEVENYLPRGFAGFNLIAEIKTGKNSLQLLSDSTWQAQPLNAASENYTGAVKRDYSFIITAPNFETKRTSWIER